MSAYGRTAFCPQCHQEYDGCGDIYIDKATREIVDYKTRRARPGSTLVAAKCPKGHVAEPVGQTSTEECPVCHTIPRYGPFGGCSEPAYIPKDIAKVLKLKGEVGASHVIVKKFDGNKYEFDPVTGKKFGEWRSRDRNKPCHDCQREIARLEKFAKQMSEREGELRTRQVDAYPAFEDGPQIYLHEEREGLEQAFLNLMVALGTPCSEDLSYSEQKALTWLPLNIPKYRRERSNIAGIFKYTPQVIEAIDQLYDAINLWGPAIAREAHDKGSSIIHALAEGRITGGEFEDNQLRYHPKTEEAES